MFLKYLHKHHSAEIFPMMAEYLNQYMRESLTTSETGHIDVARLNAIYSKFQENWQSEHTKSYEEFETHALPSNAPGLVGADLPILVSNDEDPTAVQKKQ